MIKFANYSIRYIIFLASLILIGAIPGALTQQQLTASLLLVFAATILTLAGASFWALSFSKIRQSSFLPFLLVTGQLILMVYFYVRSTLSLMIEKLAFNFFHANITVPITSFELISIALLAYLFASRRQASSKIIKPADIFTWLPFLFLVILSFTCKEYPRQISLSSDPDIHSFFAYQINKLGVVPWALKDWGGDHFLYPAGFSVLSGIWMKLSFIDPVSMIVLMPLLQTILGLLCFLSMLALLLKYRFKLKLTQTNIISASLLLVLIYFSFLPFGYQKMIFHNEGAGRTSAFAISLLTIGLSFWSAFSKNITKSIITFALSAAGIGLLANINPAESLLPGLFFAFSAVLLISQKRFHNELSAKSKFIFLFSILLPILVALNEPYYHEITWGQGIPSNSLDRSVRDKNLNIPQVSLNAFLYVVSSNPYNQLLTFTNTWMLPVPVQRTLTVILFTLFSVCFLFLAKKSKNLKLFFLFNVMLLGSIGSGFILYHVIKVVFAGGSTLLLTPYFQFSMAKFFYSLLMVFCAAIFFFQRKILLHTVAFALIAISAAIPATLVRDKNKQIVFTDLNRNKYPGAIGNVRKGDYYIFDQINVIYEKYKKNHPTALLSEYPRVLAPNSPIILNNEEWLIPQGATRILPLYTKLPVAFFYGKGDIRLFNYENYNKYVCDAFDLDWLKAQRIRFIFIPSAFGASCIYGLDKLIQSGKVIAKQKKSMLIELD